MTRRKTQQEFVAEVRKVHNDNVEVLGQYANSITPVLVRYKDCGHEEMKKPYKLVNCKHGCIKCRFDRLSKTKTKSNQDFLDSLKEKGIDYIIPLEEYRGVATKIRVRNTKCGHEYMASPHNILSGRGCPTCHGIKDDKIFREVLQKKYPGEYTVLGTYTNGLTPLLIRHNECGHEWECTPKDLIRERRCPYCMKSHAEVYIVKYLEKHGIPFQMEFTFEDCLSQKGVRLRFDFKIEVDGVLKLIEYDGTQHYKTHGLYYHDGMLTNDILKDKYCESHGIPLLRIPYWWYRTDRMEKELDKFIIK